MNRRFAPAVEAPTDPSGSAWWFAFRDDQLLVLEDGETAGLPSLAEIEAAGLAVTSRHYLGTLGESQCYVAELAPDAVAPAGMALHGLRGLFGRLQEDLFAVAGRAAQIVTWDRTHRYCGHCGTPTEHLAGERARKCPACGLTVYPRLSPCVIVLVTRGDEVLLARGLRFAEAMYSTPAGFVEAGESLEEAVEREIEEEVGVKVRDIRYFGSQPWPYPHQLMVGFTATWAEGEIRIDPNELADARWFTRDAMPRIPTPISISRRLIDSYLTGHR